MNTKFSIAKLISTRLLIILMALVAAGWMSTPVEAIDREQIQVMKKDAQAAILEMQGATAAEQTLNVSETVSVRCDKGQSVQAALDKNPGPVTIAIQGICAENVRIERHDDVILLGTDPGVDGISGMVSNPPLNAVVEIWYSNRVRIENLSVSNSPRMGLALWYSQLEIVNCRFSDNAETGLHITAMSRVMANDVEASRNQNRGIDVQYHSFLACESCDLIDNGGLAYYQGAIFAQEAGFATLWNSVVSGTRGLLAWGGDSYVDIDCVGGDPEATHDCYLLATQRAGQAWNGGGVAYYSTSLTGSLVALNASIGLQGAHQQQGSVVSLSGDSEFYAAGGWDKSGNSLEARFGPTTLKDWTRAIFGAGAVIANPVQCTDAADAFNKGAVLEGSGEVIDCPHWTP